MFDLFQWSRLGALEESYIPPHTSDDLEAVFEWAIGGAFSVYAKEARVGFDRATYVADNPYLALFNFSRATGTSCLSRDLLSGYISMAWAFQNIYRKILEGTYAYGEDFARSI